VDSVTTAVSADQTTPEPVLDARAIPLELLATDGDVCRMVTRVLESMEEPSRVRVAAFNSSI
jgi:FXSXX-COOH protein